MSVRRESLSLVVPGERLSLALGACGVALPLRLDDEHVGGILDREGIEIAVVDPNNEWPDDRAAAVVELIVAAVNELADRRLRI